MNIIVILTIFLLIIVSFFLLKTRTAKDLYGRRKMVKNYLFNKNRRPKKPLPTIKLKENDFIKKPDKDFRFVWMGHSFFIIDIEGKRIVIDPVFDNASPIPFTYKRFQKVPIERENLPDIDIILITHNHYDHLEKKTIKYLCKKNIIFIVPRGVEKYLINFGCPKEKIIVMDWWDKFLYKDLEINMTPSQHFSRRKLNDLNKSMWCSYSLIGKNKKVFFSGDGGYGKHFKKIGERFNGFDFCFIDIGSWNEHWRQVHLFPDEAIKAFKDLKGKVMIPAHWAAYNLALHKWNEPIKLLMKANKKEKINIETPKIGQIFIPGKTKTTNWWNGLK